MSTLARNLVLIRLANRFTQLSLTIIGPRHRQENHAFFLCKFAPLGLRETRGGERKLDVKALFNIKLTRRSNQNFGRPGGFVSD